MKKNNLAINEDSGEEEDKKSEYSEESLGPNNDLFEGILESPLLVNKYKSEIKITKGSSLEYFEKDIDEILKSLNNKKMTEHVSKYKKTIQKGAFNLDKMIQMEYLLNRELYKEKNHLPQMEDPFFAYGYGVVAFFRLLKNLRLIFCILAVLSLAQSYWFSNFPKNLVDFWNANWTLGGGTGSSYINKVVIPLASNKLYIQCDRSFIRDWDNDIDFQTYTGVLSIDNILSPGDFKISNMTDCLGVVGPNFREVFRSNCVGQSFCDVENLKNFLNITNETPSVC